MWLKEGKKMREEEELSRSLWSGGVGGSYDERE